jgi:hypothetical protein
MSPIFKLVVFEDEGLTPDLTSPKAKMIFCFPMLLRPALPAIPHKSYTFTNFALGYGFDATQSEMKKIREHDLFNQTALTLRPNEPLLTLADLLGPELIPEVNPNQQELLRVEARVREAALIWTHFFQGMKD